LGSGATALKDTFGQLPTNFPDNGPNFIPLIILGVAGWLILALGRVTKSKPTQIAGITMVVVATFAVPAMAFLVYR
jgi:hypothetical protein